MRECVLFGLRKYKNYPGFYHPNLIEICTNPPFNSVAFQMRSDSRCIGNSVM